MIQKEWGDIELLKWMAHASPEEIYQEAKACANVNRALTMCDHAMLTLDDDPLEARIRLLKARLSETIPDGDAAYQYLLAVQTGKASLPKDDPELQDAIKALRKLSPPDPDVELINELLDRLEAHREQEGATFEECEERLLATPDNGWTVLYFAFALECEVQNGGFDQYFANKGGYAHAETVDAFFKLGKRLGAVVAEAFQIYEKNKAKHDLSHQLKAGKVKIYDIVATEDAPGSYQGASEDYDEITDRYCSTSVGANDIYKLLAKYIRKHPSQFETLPKLSK
jgi:hypothetical protein